ncbi:hypothetical protein ACWGI8_11355 [Streptomyces sp. NPDC054841]
MRMSPPDPLHTAALRLRAQLALVGTRTLEPAETALLERWLERITQTDCA